MPCRLLAAAAALCCGPPLPSLPLAHAVHARASALRVAHQMVALRAQVHCTAPFRLIQAAAPYMRDAGKQELQAGGSASPRCIINISCVRACMRVTHAAPAHPHRVLSHTLHVHVLGAINPCPLHARSSTTGTHGNAGQANYATAKAGVIGLTKSVAKANC